MTVVMLDPIAVGDRGVARLRAGDVQEAEADFTTALRFDPLDADLRGLRGLARLTLGHWDGAASDLTLALALEPDSPHAVKWYHLRAELRFIFGAWETALADVDRALARTPLRQAGPLLWLRGRILACRGDQTAAERTFAEAAQLSE